MYSQALISCFTALLLLASESQALPAHRYDGALKKRSVRRYVPKDSPEAASPLANFIRSFSSKRDTKPNPKDDAVKLVEVVPVSNAAPVLEERSPNQLFKRFDDSTAKANIKRQLAADALVQILSSSAHSSSSHLKPTPTLVRAADSSLVDIAVFPTITHTIVETLVPSIVVSVEHESIFTDVEYVVLHSAQSTHRSRSSSRPANTQVIGSVLPGGPGKVVSASGFSILPKPTATITPTDGLDSPINDNGAVPTFLANPDAPKPVTSSIFAASLSVGLDF